MKSPDVFFISLWILGSLLLGVILVRLLRSCFNRITWTAESFSESTEPLSNPYQGFYHIIRYTLSDDALSSHSCYAQVASYTAPLALLEINLKHFRESTISEAGLAQLNDILTAWSQSPAHTKLILRFLYDWDGLALAAEPSSLQRILIHMDQISPLVNRHCDTVYLMQGIFIGNWGEMHHSRFSDDASVKTLIQHLHSIIAPSIFLSVRTPAQWRMIHDVYDLPAKFPAFGAKASLMGRLGLFNDGILGSQSDLGTYGNTARRNAASPSERYTRADELAFQNALCSYVPNGGEVIYHPVLSSLETSASVLRAMHISYLNADYDSRVLEKWRAAVWTGDDSFHGCDGYRYIEAHLGYRYLIRACKIKKGGWFKLKLTLTLTMQNNGFSSTLKPFQAAIVLKHTQTGACTRVPFHMDLRKLGSGQKQSFSMKLPVNTLEHGSYQLYISINDEASGQMILLGNKSKAAAHGYLLGQLDK